MTTDSKSNLEELVGSLGEHLLQQLLLLRKFCQLNHAGRSSEVKIVAASACTTGNAIHLLSRKPDYFYGETVMLTRAFIEKITNFCYLQICDESEYKKFLAHPYYRAFHNAERSKFAGETTLGLKFSGKSQMLENQKVAEALSIFSDTNPRLNWSSLKIDEKVSVIASKAKVSPEFFLMNTLTIYSDASEALHGSLYGCALPTGAYIPGEQFGDAQRTKESLLKKTALLYVQLGSLIHELLKMFNEREDVESLIGESKKNNEVAVELMKTIFIVPKKRI